MQTITASTGSPSLEAWRPTGQVDWQFVASGLWSQGRHHSGHVAYLLATIAPGQWILESVERNAELDGISQEDIDEGRLNDDQEQALWGTTLEEAQNAEDRTIVAVCTGAATDASPSQIAAVLYKAICEAGGKAIDEQDEVEGLLEL